MCPPPATELREQVSAPVQLNGAVHEPDLPSKPAEPSTEVAPAAPPKKRRGRPRKNSAPTEEGEYPVIGHAPSGAPQFGSMRMKVVEEKVVDGHTVKVLPPGYAMGAKPPKNVCVRS